MSLALDVLIRQATAEDLPRLEWFGQFWQFRGLFTHAYKDQIAGRCLMLVADLNGFPIGRLFIRMAASGPSSLVDGFSRAYLYSLHVMDMFQRQGIGTRLMQTAERCLIDRGFRWATISVAKDNLSARRLYERLGYRCFGEDPGTWSYVDPDGRQHRVEEPSWLLEKALTP
jgi:ribosomal protein S18 acetylase RimI-like enzyme